MSLRRINSINLFTTQGLCQIELLIGDITQMKEKEKVDLLLVSTHPSYYYVRNEPLMKALNKNMNIMIDDLSRDPDVDLRKNYLCWLSKPLPDKLPFRRLACFDRQADSRNLSTSIRNVFRGLIPILNYCDKTAVTNLLGSWNQHFDRAQVLNMTVNAACNWMKVGLQLRCLKIVLCEKDSKNNFIDIEDCIEEFEKLKDKWTIKKSLRFQYRYDVYISYHKYDKKKADALALTLTQANSNLNIFYEPVTKCTKAWPEQAMVKIYGCKRFFVILTSYYVKSKDCLDDFMIAICYQNALEDLEVVPLCMETFHTLPPMIRNYPVMDCKLARGEKLSDKFRTICENMSLDFTISKVNSKSVEDDDGPYDIYISYSEEHWRDAEIAYRTLKGDNPNLNIFYDKMGIKNERTWTYSTYRALEEVQCCIILVSPDYFSTKLCREEFNVVVARRLFGKCEKQIAVISLCVSDFLFVPKWFGRIRMIDARGPIFRTSIEMVSTQLIQSFEKNTLQKDFDWLVQEEIDANWCLEDELHRYRKDLFCEHYFEHHANVVPRIMPQLVTKPLKIVICFSVCDRRIVALLANRILKEIQWVHLVFLQKVDRDSYYHLEKADHIIMFVCQEYLSSKQGQEILAICMERQRVTRRRIVHFARTSLIPECLSYLKILPYSVCFTDQIWGRMRKKYPRREKVRVSIKGVVGRYTCEKFESLALEKLIYSIIISEQFKCTFPDELNNMLPILKIFHRKKSQFILEDLLDPCPSEFQNMCCLSKSIYESDQSSD